jgi:uncharacterized membrane protein
MEETNMTALILGLIIFIGMHSVRIVADDFRTRQIAKVGARTWKAMHAAVSIVGFLLLVIGYGIARGESVLVWNPPLWTHYVAILLTIPAFILFAASSIPGTRIRAKAGHPLLAGVKTWSFAHLIANGTLADILLFGAFLLWSIAAYASARRRDRKAGTLYPVGPVTRDVMAIIAGSVAWAVFAFWLHGLLIGVSPLGMASAVG